MNISPSFFLRKFILAEALLCSRFGISSRRFGSGLAIAIVLLCYFPSFSQVQINSMIARESRCQSSGMIVVHASGGTSPYTYSIVAGPLPMPSQNSNSLTALPSGAYTVAVTDFLNNTVTGTVVVPGNYAVPVLSPSITQPLCYNGSDGQITANVVQGRNPYSWTLYSASGSSTQSNNAFSNLPVGTYTIQAKDSCSNFQTQTVVLNAGGGTATAGGWSLIRKTGCDTFEVTYRVLRPANFDYSPPYTYYYTTSNGLSNQTYTTSYTAGAGNSEYRNFQAIGYNTTVSMAVVNACGYTVSASSQTIENRITANSFVDRCGRSYSAGMSNPGNFSDPQAGPRFLPPIHYYLIDAVTSNTVGSHVGVRTWSGWPFSTLDSGIFRGYPNGNYTIKIADACGTTVSTSPFVWDNTLQPLTMTYGGTDDRTCLDSATSVFINMYNANTTTTLTIVSGPASWHSSSPHFSGSFNYTYPYSFKVNLYGNYTMLHGLASGTYSINAVDSCGRTASVAFTVNASNVKSQKYSFDYIKGCVNGNTIRFSNNLYSSNPGEGTTFVRAQIKNVNTNTVIFSSNNNSPVNMAMPNMPAAKYALELEYYFTSTWGPATNLINFCPPVIYDTIVLPTYYNPAFDVGAISRCNSGYAIALQPDLLSGTMPYTYEITSGPGGYTASPQASPVFSALTPGVYNFRMIDSCGNSFTRFIAVDSLALIPSLKASGLCGGDTLSLIPTFQNSYYTYLWTLPDLTTSSQPTFTISPYTLASAGNYSISATVNIAGCISSETKSLYIPGPLKTNISEADTSICPGSHVALNATHTGGYAPFTYTWSPTAGLSNTGLSPTATPTTTATYVLATTDNIGCISRDSIKIAVSSFTAAMTSPSTATVCSGVALHMPFANPNAAHYTWFAANNANTTGESVSTQTTGILNDVIINPGPGPQDVIYYVTPSNSLNCTGPIQTVTVTVNAMPVIRVLSVSNASVCPGGSVTITPGGASSYTLMPGGLTGTSFTVSPTSSSTYTLSGTSPAGCVSPAAADPAISVVVSPTPTIGIASVSNSTVCAGGTVVIAPNGAASYTLMPGNYSGTMFTVSPTVTTIYTISGSSTTGCLSSAASAAQLTITVSPSQSVSIASVSNQSLCPGNSSVISLSGAGSYNLMPGNLSGSSFTVSPSVTTTYTITGILTAGCLPGPANTVTPTIVVYRVPTVTLNYKDSITCFGGVATVTANAAGGAAPYVYNWQNNPSSGTVAIYAAGTYTVLVRDANLCASAAASISIAQPGAPIGIHVSDKTPACPTENNGSVTLVISGGTPAYQIVWSNGVIGNTVSNAGPGLLSAEITDARGCRVGYNTNMDVKPCTDIYIPQLFTPNGDGKNDTFVISSIKDFPDNSLHVFNRWGNMVYSKRRYENEWDGKPNVGDATGKSLLPAGTYFIVLDFGDGVTKTYNGYVQLEY